MGLPMPDAPPEPPRATVEYVILGLLSAQMPQEVHGYDLGRALADGVLGQIVRVESGMLYHYLKRLSRDGLISTRVEPQVGRPDRQLHATTPEGSSALQSWLSAPVRSTREIRLEFLLKLYFARHLDPERARRLVGEQIVIMRQRSGRLLTQLGRPQPPTADNQFGEAVLRLRHGQTDSALEWLESLPEASGTSAT
jgi:PadR family transcriptional regulator AphA